jgi:Zn-dependent protease with chaperone function
MLDLSGPLQRYALPTAISLALLPAALNWWWTSRFPIDGDQHARPERFWARAQRVSLVTSACAGAIAVLAGWAAVWILPLEVVALACTNHRTRQRLFGETWPLHRFLQWRLRFFAGVWGFWVCLALTPAMIAQTSPSLRWWVAAVAFLVLLAWHHWYSRVLLFVLGAARLTRPDLEERFQQVFGRACVPPPEIWRVGCDGATLMNALALPSLTGNCVLFFDTLLARLSGEEITATLAHEVAHLEHYTPRLRRLSMIGIGSIAVFTLSGAIGDTIWTGLSSWLPLTSIVAVFVGLALRAQRLRPKETEADLRAVDLCGNPEALISGLTQIYTVNHVPRRWSARTEEHATHPSLAKRIADIRRHAQTPEPPPATERVVIASPESGRWALIEYDRVTFLWVDADTTATTEDLVERAQRLERLAFAELIELRVASSRGGALSLTAADRHARRWSMAVHEHDAARVQAALDRIDHLIVASAPTQTRFRFGDRLVAVTALMTASALGAFAAVVVPGLLMLRRPARRLALALSIALIGTAIAIAVHADDSYTEMLVLALLSAVALWEARALGRDEPARHSSAWQWIEPAAFVAPVALGAVLIAVDTRDLYDLHVAVRDRAWFPAAAMSLAAFSWFSPAARMRRTMSIVAVAAAAALAVSAPWFLLHVVRDDLVASMPELTDATVSLTTISQRTVDGSFTSVSLASDGNTFLLAADADEPESEDDPQSPRRYLVGASSGWSRSFEALEAVLVDGNRLLALERTAHGSRLRVEDVRSGREMWTLPIDSKDFWQIQAAPDGRWRALRSHGRHMTRIEGRVGSTDTHDTTWTIAAGDGYAEGRFVDGPFALGLISTWPQPLLFWQYEDWRPTTRLVRVDIDSQEDIVRSRLSVDCPMSPIGVDEILCVSFDGRWSRFWRFDPRTGQQSAAGQRYGALWGIRPLTPTLAAARDGVQSILIALDSRTSTMLRHPWGACGVNDFSVAGQTVAIACAGARNTEVTLYRLPNGGALRP